MTEIIEMIAADLMLPSSAIENAIKFARFRYRRLKVQKHSGGLRIITQPAAGLKPILAWINFRVFANLPVSMIATAFRRNTSILTNASAHKDSLYSVRVDICDFFPSIYSKDLQQVITTAKNHVPPWAATQEAFNLFRQVCFDQNEKLPIGYSTSPAIANAVMHQIDSSLIKMISDEKKFGRSILTRYADDFVFSSNLKGACNFFVEALAEELNKCQTPSLIINSRKTRYMSRAGGSTLVTGLRINNQGVVVVHPTYRDHVRLLLKLFKSNKLKGDEVPKLIGHLAHIEHVDPGFFTKLSVNYYEQIDNLRNFKSPQK